MKLRIFLSISFLLVKFGFAQIQGVVLNKVTNQPIPYVNIWISGENIGTSSNFKGEFSIQPSDSSKLIQFSAIGFKTYKVELSKLKQSIFLHPNAFQIEEVQINASKQSKNLVIGRVKNLESNMSYGANKIPWIVSRFIEYDSNYNETPYISRVRFRTKSKIKNAKFIVHIQLPDENGQPGKYLSVENIYGYAKKGNKVTEVDLIKHQISFPNNGIFIGVERIIIEENKVEFNATTMDTNEKVVVTYYQPILKGDLDLNNNSWHFARGIWYQSNKTKNLEKMKNESYSPMLAVELVLSN